MIITVRHIDVFLPIAMLVLRAPTMPFGDTILRHTKQSEKTTKHSKKNCLPKKSQYFGDSYFNSIVDLDR